MIQDSISDSAYVTPQTNEETNDGDEDRDKKRECRGEEQSTTQFLGAKGAEAEHAHTLHTPHKYTAPPASPRMDPASVHRGHIVIANDGLTPELAFHSSEIAIPSKRPYPFNNGVLRKKRKIERYVKVRIYKQRKDLGHTDEIECALTPEGGLDLVGLSEKLNIEGCQASCLNSIPI